MSSRNVVGDESSQIDNDEGSPRASRDAASGDQGGLREVWLLLRRVRCDLLADAVLVTLLGADGRLAVVCGANAYGSLAPAEVVLDGVGQRSVIDAWLHGRVIATNDAGNDALLCAPVVVFGTPVGTLDVHALLGREWSAADCAHAGQFARVLGGVFERLLIDVERS